VISVKLKSALGFIDPKYKDPSICEACGEEFACGASLKGCWCMKVELSDETRADLKSKYKRCLCAKCLQKLSVEPKQPL